MLYLLRAAVTLCLRRTLMSWSRRLTRWPLRVWLMTVTVGWTQGRS